MSDVAISPKDIAKFVMFWLVAPSAVGAGVGAAIGATMKHPVRGAFVGAGVGVVGSISTGLVLRAQARSRLGRGAKVNSLPGARASTQGGS
jgi:hypothetical protein